MSDLDLYGLPGAPFDDGLVGIASAAIRAEAGWHIAPVVTETVTVDSYGGPLLVLPSRRIVAVTAVRSGVDVLAGWTRVAAGLFRNRGFYGWPVGPIEVDLTHGYETAPMELLEVVAERVRSAADARDANVQQRTRTAGPFTEIERFQGGVGGSRVSLDPRVARYALPSGVA